MLYDNGDQDRPKRQGRLDRKTLWMLAIVAVILIVVWGVGDGGGNGAPAAPITNAPTGYIGQYGGESSVYSRIAGMSDCSSLQQQFDIAAANNNVADPGTVAHRASLGYMKAADDRMRTVGCY